MGRFAIDVELANDRDLIRAKLGHISSDQVRKVGVLDVVGTRATRLVLPAAIVEQLGLEITGTTTARYPDGRTVQLPLATQVHLAYGGRSGIFNAVVDPDKDRALIGAIVLNELDFVIDCTGEHLVPRDPKQITMDV